MAGKKVISSPANITFKISEEKLLGKNAEIVYSNKINLIDEIKRCITSNECRIEIVDRNKKNTKYDTNAYIGINANSVNDIIREKLKSIDNMCFETNVEYGAFFERNTKSNFDFSFYNRMLNYCNFWNKNYKYTEFEKIISDTIQDKDKKTWDEFIELYTPKPNMRVEYIGNDKCNIVGEIQMGNWALIYKDIFRLLKAKDSPGVDLYIYITNTGLLQRKLSDGIVTFKKATAEFEDLIDVIGIPILVLGLDIDNYDATEFEKAHDEVLRITNTQN